MKLSLWRGYSIAPLTGPLLYLVIMLFIPSVTDNKEFSAEMWFISLLLYSLTSYIICFTLGVPLVYLLKKYNKFSFFWLAIIGSTLYSVAIYILLFVVLSPTITGNIITITVYAFLIGFSIGFSVVTVFSYTTGIIRHSS